MTADVALIISAVAAAASVYAVLVSRRGLVWQQRRDAERRTPSLQVNLSQGSGTNDMVIMRLDDDQPLRWYYRVSVNVVNAGETTEFLSSIWAQTVDRSSLLGVTERRGGDDLELKPKARASFDFNAERLTGFENGFVVGTRLASGREFR